MPGMAQSTNAIVSGLVLDPSGKPIVGADVEMVNDATGIRYPGATNSEGIYQIPNLPPGPYRLQVAKPGFKTLIKPDIVLRTQDALAVNFTLPVGAAIGNRNHPGRASRSNRIGRGQHRDRPAICREPSSQRPQLQYSSPTDSWSGHCPAAAGDRSAAPPGSSVSVGEN